jgi:glucose/arabinose dehydrogenase
VPPGFRIEAIATVVGARELAALPNGDLLVATEAQRIWLVPQADGPAPGDPVIFTGIDDAPLQGVAFDPYACTVFIAGQTGVEAIPYVDALTSAPPGNPIALVRQGAAQTASYHVTSSVAAAQGALFVSAGSSCNACVETDPTRAAISELAQDGAAMTVRASRIRNAIALVINPMTGTLWAGNAGQDLLPPGHPYELFDPVTLHPGVADYGWPDCEENRVAYTDGADCSATVVPRVELPAYSTIIGAAFYPTYLKGAHAFPATYRGGAFLTAHGSGHPNGPPPRVAYVPMLGDVPTKPVDWADPTVQWSEFVGGFQLDDASRVARPTGVAVGYDGTLYFSDDLGNTVYRVRPN